MASGAELTLYEMECLRDDQKIRAIKSIRERTGLGLLEGKALADAAEVAMGLVVLDHTTCYTCHGSGTLTTRHKVSRS